MKIGLFFGSFNPVHMGHLIIAQTIVQEAALDKVWFVVSPHNPFKKQTDLLHEFDRYELVQRAVTDNPQLEATDIEFNMPRPSYTADTLVRLHERFPQHEFSIIMGEDNLAGLHKWKNPDYLLQHRVIVYPRPHALTHPYAQHAQFTFVQAPMMDISATYIRKLVRAGKSLRYLVPDEVGNYIAWKKFYL